MLNNLKNYYKPKTIPEALALLEKNSGSILVIAGGTKLVQTKNNIVKELVDITSLGLSYIKESTGEIRIGATTTLQSLIENPILKNNVLQIIPKAVFNSTKSKMIRNVSTIGGELVTSNSLSLLYCALLVLQAQIRIVGGEEFALSLNIFLNKKGLGGGLLMECIIPKPQPETYTSMAPIFHENGKALICACTRITFYKGKCIKVKIAITGTEKIPQRLYNLEQYLENKDLNISTIEESANIVHDLYKPVSDSLASAEFRQEVSRVVIKKTLTDCLSQAQDIIE